MQRKVVGQVAGKDIVVMDSVSFVRPRDHGQVVIAGSNGGHASAVVVLGAQLAFIALNDAGFGRDNAGVCGLSEVDERNIPGVGISHDSAEISNGLDMWDAGIVSFVNETARAVGVTVGMTLRRAVGCWGEAQA